MSAENADVPRKFYSRTFGVGVIFCYRIVNRRNHSSVEPRFYPLKLRFWPLQLLA